MALKVRSEPFSWKGYRTQNGNRIVEKRQSGTHPYAYIQNDTPVSTRRPKPKEDFIPPTPYQRIIYTGTPTHQYCFINAIQVSAGNPNAFFELEYVGPYRAGITPVDNSLVYEAVPAFVNNGANNKALANLKNGKTSMGLAFAERRKTATHVNDTIRSIARAVSAVKRGDMRSATRALKAQHRGKDTTASVEFSKRWLEIQYGWRPLIGDVSDAVQALNERDAADPQRYTVSAIGKFNHTTDVTVHRAAGPIYRGFELSSERVQTTRHFSKHRVDAFVDNAFLGELNNFGFLDAASIAWEVVPWSFVADWFLPVGKYLDLITATAGLNFRSGSVSHVHEINRTISHSLECDTRSYRPVSQSVGFLPCNSRRFELRRSVMSSFPTPSLSLSKDPMRGLRVMNAVALLRSKFN